MDDIGVQKEIFVFIKAAPKQIYQFRKKRFPEYEKNFIESHYALRNAIFLKFF